MRVYKTPDFSTFSGEDGKSIIEHINHFMAHCGGEPVRQTRRNTIDFNYSIYFSLGLFSLGNLWLRSQFIAGPIWKGFSIIAFISPSLKFLLPS